MLLSRISAPQLSNPTQEDIFASSISSLFTDDTQNSHGTPGHSVIYTSPTYGDIKLGIPQHPDVEEGRKLFAHYLWNAGVIAADAIEVASSSDGTYPATIGESKVKWDRKYWNIRGRDLLELGAGTSLPSLISALSSARSVTITDHPSSPALVTNTIAQNVLENLKINLLSPTIASTLSDTPSPLQVSAPSDQPNSSPRTSSTIAIHGLTWGDSLFTSATHYGKPSFPQPAHHSFDKIIIADCLWMPNQHANIVKTVNTYLQQGLASTFEESGSETVPCALVVACFHTGRRVVAQFFQIATGSKTGILTRGNNASNQFSAHPEEDEEDTEDEDEDADVEAVRGTLRAAEIFEVDVDCNVRGWLPERPGESREQAKRWCVCAVLVKEGRI